MTFFRWAALCLLLFITPDGDNKVLVTPTSRAIHSDFLVPVCLFSEAKLLFNQSASTTHSKMALPCAHHPP